MSEYDSDNIFAKILDKKEPCFKVFESPTTLAFLDAFPMVDGHTVVVPKLKGHTDLISMPPAKSAAFLSDVQRVARAVKAATGAAGINIWQNSGADAGQTVFHPHVHIVPRRAGDGLQLGAPQAEHKISSEAAGLMQGKIAEVMNPPKPLKKAKYDKVSSVDPNKAPGANFKVRVVGEPKVVEARAGKFWEVLCGDATGTVVVSLREHQKDVAIKGAVIALRNASIKMISSHVCIAVDKWGKVEASDEEIDGEVLMAQDKNVSATEYELVDSGK